LLPATPARPKAARLQIHFDAPRLDQIRAAGCHLLFQHGYAGMTMRQIAARLNLKAASLYYHFPSKQDILFDLMRRTVTDLLEGLRRITASGQGPAGQLEDAVRWHVLFHTQKREEAFVSHSELRSLEPAHLKAILKLREEYEQLFDTILREGQRQGIFQSLPSGSAPQSGVIRNAILTMCTATAGWFSPDGRLSAAEVTDQIWNFIAAAVLQRPPASN